MSSGILDESQKLRYNTPERGLVPPISRRAMLAAPVLQGP